MTIDLGYSNAGGEGTAASRASRKDDNRANKVGETKPDFRVLHCKFLPYYRMAKKLKGVISLGGVD